MLPFLQVTTLSAIVNASGPLTLMTEIAPVPGTVAGAYIVSSFLMYMVCPNFRMCVMPTPDSRPDLSPIFWPP